MATSPTSAEAFDLTVRVGCSLTYEVTGSATLLLNMKPRPDRRHAVLEESLVLGPNLRTDAFDDSHGNRVHRLSLPAGRHEVRHDAIIRVYAQPILRLGQAGEVRVG